MPAAAGHEGGALSSCFARLLWDAGRTCGDMWGQGWAEANGGNISYRLRAEDMVGSCELSSRGAWVGLERGLAGLGGERFLVTSTGSYLRNVALAPERDLGIIELNEGGTHYRVVWGFGGSGGPSSELGAHLEGHAVRKALTAGRDRVGVHGHTPNLLALTLAYDFDYRGLSRLLWGVHGECIVIFPKGVGYVPYSIAGTGSLAVANGESLAGRPICVWQLHGAFSMGATFEEAFGLMEAAEKAAGVYLQAAGAGGVKHGLSVEQMVANVAHFGLEIDGSILGEAG